MQKIEILMALLHLHNMNYGAFDTNELKAWLHSLRSITREIEKEIISRDRSQLAGPVMHEFYSHVN